MVLIRGFVACLVAATLFFNCAARAEDNTKEIEALQKDIENLRNQLRNANRGGVTSSVDKALESKYGPNATVTTKQGKLVIGGLVQVWYMTMHDTQRGLFSDKTVNGIFDSNAASNNDTFRIRYAELKFTMQIHENISAYVMIDPAAEATSYPDAPFTQGLFKRANQVAPEFDGLNGPGLGDTSAISSVQFGSGRVPRLLRDAYINYHDFVPHHDFTVGQFIPKFGEEGVRSDAQLDFVERSFIGQVTNERDLGLQVHGSWWNDDCTCKSTDDGRFQYWLAVLDGAGNYYLSAGSPENRSDDNNQKDFLGSLLVRPVWKHETWGSLELGGAAQLGDHGGGGNADPINNPTNGLNRNKTFASRYNAYGYYAPGSIVKGWWLRGEYLSLYDRNAPGTVIAPAANGGTDIGNTGSGSGLAQSNGKPFASHAWNISTGYKLSDSSFCEDKISPWLKPLEFAFRYESDENIQIADPVRADHTDVFRTQVYTVGLNYYIKGHNAKIQANYNWVRQPSGLQEHGLVNFYKTNTDNFIVSFQVAF